MTTTQYTPAPWEYERTKDNDGIELWQIIRKGFVETDDDPDADVQGIIAGIWGKDPWDEANARLMSASPDLLEALQEMMAKFINFSIPDETRMTNAPALHATIVKARAAIAKALGAEAI